MRRRRRRRRGTGAASLPLVLSYANLDALRYGLSPRRTPRAAGAHAGPPDPERPDPARRGPARAAGPGREPHGAPRGGEGPRRQGAGRIAPEDGHARAPAPRLEPPRPGRARVAAGRRVARGLPAQA